MASRNGQRELAARVITTSSIHLLPPWPQVVGTYIGHASPAAPDGMAPNGVPWERCPPERWGPAELKSVTEGTDLGRDGCWSPEVSKLL